MTGNTFAPAAVAQAIDLIRCGATALRSAIHREHRELTPLGLDRVIDLARHRRGDDHRVCGDHCGAWGRSRSGPHGAG
jgi:hypothetical protein